MLMTAYPRKVAHKVLALASPPQVPEAQRSVEAKRRGKGKCSGVAPTIQLDQAVFTKLLTVAYASLGLVLFSRGFESPQ